MTLQAALQASAAGDPGAALVALLEVWRATRSSRVADAIDRVSADVTARLEPIEAKTVAARTVAWLEIAALKDPRDVGRLIAVPLPRTIKALRLCIDALLAFDDDPRIATALVRFVEESIIDTNAGRRLDVRALMRVRAVRDVRVLPRLRGLITGTYGRRGYGIEQTIEALEAVTDAVDDPDDILGQLLAVSDDEARLLAAIYERPDDDAAVAVYGDWLSERGDPRGEFIALQLAAERGAATEASERRERELVEQHGRSWAGALDRCFAEERREYARGFLVGGRLAAIDLDEALRDPAWALIRRIDVDPKFVDLAARLLVRPELRSLRSAGVFSFEHATMIAAGTPCPTLRELHVAIAGADELDSVSRCDALPALETLGVHGEHAGLAEWCRTAPVVDRVTRIATTSMQASTFEALASRRGALREIEVLQDHDGIHSDWSVRLVRDAAPGPFTRVVANRRHGTHASVLQFKLERIPAEWPRTLVVTTERPLLADEAERIERVLGRFPNLAKTDLPWKRPDRARTIDFQSSHHERPYDAEPFPHVWEALAAFGQRYDVFQMNRSETLRPLGKKPLQRLLEWLGRKMYCFKLRREGGAELVDFLGGMSGRLVLGERTYPELLAWFTSFATLTKMSLATLGRVEGTLSGLSAFGGPPEPGWLMLFDEGMSAQLDVTKLRAIAAETPELRALVVEPLGNHLVMRFGDEPSQATPAAVAALQAVLAAMLRDSLVARHGFVFRDEVRKHLDPIATQLGFVLRAERIPTQVTYDRVQETRVELEVMIDIRLPTHFYARMWTNMYARGFSSNHPLCDAMIASGADLATKLDETVRALAASGDWLAAASRQR